MPANPIETDQARAAVTHDAFLGGRVTVAQPAKGFRAGLDTVLLAAAVDPASRRVLELGAGAGIASICMLADLPGAGATLAERDPDMLALARKNAADNGCAERALFVEIDVAERGALRERAGLRPDHYTSIIANPPFFDERAGTRAAGDQRGAARHMAEDGLERWVRTAAAHAAPGGEFIIVHTAEVLPKLLAALGKRFGAITLLPVAPRPGQPASRILVRAIKGSRAPLRLMSALVMHGTAGNGFSPEADEIFRGRARLEWPRDLAKGARRT